MRTCECEVSTLGPQNECTNCKKPIEREKKLCPLKFVGNLYSSGGAIKERCYCEREKCMWWKLCSNIDVPWWVASIDKMKERR